MDIIDNYINSFYKEDNNIEVLELKEEIKEHLILSANEFIKKGFNEDEAYMKAIEKFDDGGDMIKELYSALKENTEELKETNKLLYMTKLKFVKTFKYIFILSLIVTVVSIGMYKYQNDILLKQNLLDVKKLITEIASTKEITKPETYKEELDTKLLDDKFKRLIYLEIHSGVNENTLVTIDNGQRFDNTGLQLQYSYKSEVISNLWADSGISDNKTGKKVWYNVGIVYNADKWLSCGLIFAVISIITFIIYQYNRYVLARESKKKVGESNIL